jgi:VWFA-related protein
VPANITDAKGRHVTNLEASEFSVLDNGRPQKATVDTIDTGIAPIALVIAVQSSGISSAVLEKVQKIGSLIQPLITGERGCAGLVSFAERVTWLQDCTKDPDAFQRALYELRPGEHKQGRMLDAADSAILHLRKHLNARRVLLLISESRDRDSETAAESVAMEAQSAGVTVYAATYSALKTAFTSKRPVSESRLPQGPKTPRDEMGTVDGAPPSRSNPKIPPPEQRVDLLGGIGELLRLYKENTTEFLTTATGGTMFPFTRQKALEEAVQKLGAELHSQYLLSFVPHAPAPGYHAIEVRVTRPGEFRIRARPGYWAAEDPGSQRW